jgi:hypothetical protein
VKYEIVIKRGTRDHDGGYDHFEIDADESATVLWVLEQLDLKTPLYTINGKKTEKIGWECSCKQSILAFILLLKAGMRSILRPRRRNRLIQTRSCRIQSNSKRIS